MEQLCCSCTPLSLLQGKVGPIANLEYAMIWNYGGLVKSILFFKTKLKEYSTNKIPLYYFVRVDSVIRIR
jgi:hypothetical protein